MIKPLGDPETCEVLDGKVKIELGPGLNRQVMGAFTIDSSFFCAPNIRANLEYGLPFLEDQSVDEVHGHHVFEHIERFEELMVDCYRVLRPGGVLTGSVPHFSNPYFFSDPTHRRTFGLYTFDYFCTGMEFQRTVPVYRQTGFICRELRLKFKSPFRRRNHIKKIIEWVVNFNIRTLEIYEENFCYSFPAYELWFLLEKPK